MKDTEEILKNKKEIVRSCGFSVLCCLAASTLLLWLSFADFQEGRVENSVAAVGGAGFFVVNAVKEGLNAKKELRQLKQEI